jgi:ribA/ribD-fused uncharacterized protein
MHFNSELLGATLYPKENFLFFYGGIFSQWARWDFFCNSLQVKVNCAEQAMMLHKAKFFNDDISYKAILLANNPREQKNIGRKVKNYDEALWSDVRYKFVKGINYDKFTQVKELTELLFLTRPYCLVEASPTDRIWGIGMSKDNTYILDTTFWGMNLLGKAITEVRDEIFNDNFVNSKP